MTLYEKRVAVGMFGIHFQESLQHWMGWITNVNYKTVMENNQAMLFQHFTPTFFSSTYFSSQVSQLLNDFDFHTIKMKKIRNIKSSAVEDAFVIRNTIFLDTIEVILGSKETFDYVLLMRYDLQFKTSPITNLNFDKINLLCRTKWGTNEDLVDDNFYFMPFSKLQFFYETVKSIPLNVSSHEYEHYFPNDEFSYAVEGKFYSHEIPIYSIRRN